MYTISGTLSQFPDDFPARLASYRHKVFIERLGWSLPAQNGEEQDQFDRSDTLYVVVFDQYHTIRGCARLLPTTRPYLLGEVFPQLLDGKAVPCCVHTWELSRFAADRPAMTRMLLAAVLNCAAERGATSLVAISSVGVERLLLRMGVKVTRTGAPAWVDNKEIFACRIALDSGTRKALVIAATNS